MQTFLSEEIDLEYSAMTEQQQEHENMVAQREITEESFIMNDDDNGDETQYAEAV